MNEITLSGVMHRFTARDNNIEFYNNKRKNEEIRKKGSSMRKKKWFAIDRKGK